MENYSLPFLLLRRPTVSMYNLTLASYTVMEVEILFFSSSGCESSLPYFGHGGKTRHGDFERKIYRFRPRLDGGPSFFSSLSGHHHPSIHPPFQRERENPTVPFLSLTGRRVRKKERNFWVPIFLVPPFLLRNSCAL